MRDNRTASLHSSISGSPLAEEFLTARTYEYMTSQLENYHGSHVLSAITVTSDKCLNTMLFLMSKNLN